MPTRLGHVSDDRRTISGGDGIAVEPQWLKAATVLTLGRLVVARLAHLRGFRLSVRAARKSSVSMALCRVFSASRMRSTWSMKPSSFSLDESRPSARRPRY